MKRRQEKKDKEIYQTDGTGRKHKVKWQIEDPSYQQLY